MHNQIANPSPTLERPDLSHLMTDQYPAVYRLALSILDDPDEADDAAQEAFIAAARALDSFEQRSNLRTWLFAIAVNVCRAHLRRRKALQVKLQLLQAVQVRFARTQSPEETALESERGARLWKAVDRLNEKHRLPVLLYYVQEMPANEIAQVLGISEGTVHSRLHYARQQLLRQFQRDSTYQDELREILP